MRLLTVVVPAYNEDASLELFLPRVVEHCRDRGYHLIVVDDGSRDGTAKIIDGYAAQGKLMALHHKVNRGYGAAIKSGILSANTEFVVTTDADGQHSLDDIDGLCEMIIERDADIVVGWRKGYKSPSIYKSIGKKIIRFCARILMPVPIVNDMNCGLKIFRTEVVLKCLHLCPDSMAFSDIITLIFINRRHLVLEMPVTVEKRLAGRSAISTRTAFETVMEILNMLILFNPMRVFIPVSIVCVVGGISLGLPFIIMGRGVSVGAMLAIVTGIISFFLGLICEQLSQIRRQRTADTKPLSCGEDRCEPKTKQ